MRAHSDLLVIACVAWLVAVPFHTAVHGAQPAARTPAAAQTGPADAQLLGGPSQQQEPLGSWEVAIPSYIALPLATVLGAILALRPRRRGTPERSSQVVQTQIILAIIGALVMIVVGTSLARAFGVVGAAGLVRYRAKIDHPKDAGVMLTTLAVGLACGVGVYGLAVFATLFLVGVLWVIESFEPSARKEFILEIKTKDAATLRPRIEALFRRRRIKYELREVTPEAISFLVQLAMDMKTDAISAEILSLDAQTGTGVEWKTEGKKAA